MFYACSQASIFWTLIKGTYLIDIQIMKIWRERDLSAAPLLRSERWVKRRSLVSSMSASLAPLTKLSKLDLLCKNCNEIGY